MLGERALDLVREGKRSNDMLGPYNEDKVTVYLLNKILMVLSKLFHVNISLPPVLFMQ